MMKRLLFLLCACATAAAAEGVSFQYDVMPILAKTGCNTGACHGAQTGKGELSLSLRGESPRSDYDHLVASSLWVNPEEPEKSFLLRKSTLDVEHDGGKRFEPDSEAHEILRRWIAEGASYDPGEAPDLASLEVAPSGKVLFEPERELQLNVTAHWADGSERDVTRWAIYEPSNLIVEAGQDGFVRALKPGEVTVNVRFLGLQKPVRLIFVPERKGFSWNRAEPANFIDERIFAKLKLVRSNPSPVCDDATFVRRAFLDLIGVIPTPEEARRFVTDENPDKRAALVGELLERPEFADFWALKWADLLRVEEKLLDTQGVSAFHEWIRDQIAANRPLDEFVTDILVSRGSTYRNGAANYYRALRDPALRAEATAQVFLGTRLNCAKCHNHPFERWTMDDYYQFAAVFDGIDYKIVENKRRDKNDKSQFIGEQIVLVDAPRSLKDPRTKEYPVPRLLDEETKPRGEDRFEVLADWLTAPENTLFARVQANRIWFHLMGRGLVEPVDDFRSTNPPSHPELLDELSKHFVESGFDLRELIRVIAASKTYQLSAEPNATNEDDELNFSHRTVARLGAEQLLDSMHQALDVPAEFNGFETSLRAAQLPGVHKVYRDPHPSMDDRFLKLFGRPLRLTNSDMERSHETSLAQVFELVSGETLATLLSKPENRIGRLLADGNADGEILEELYWTILTRAPGETERDAILNYVSRAPDRRAAFEDVVWGLLNSKEFLLRK